MPEWLERRLAPYHNGAFFFHMKLRELKITEPEKINWKYEKFLNELSPNEWREYRTEEYWKQRDKLNSLVEKKLFTINWIEKHRSKKSPSPGRGAYAYRI